MAEARPQRIDNITAGLMIAVAVLFDIMGFVLDLIFSFIGATVFGSILSFLAWLIFGIWFFFLGIGLLSARRLAAFGSGIIVEAIPVLNMLPGVTVSVAAIVIMIKLEDKTGLKMPAVKK